MHEYNIKIFNQSRVLISLFLLPIFFLLSIFLGAEIHSLLIPILSLLILIFVCYYFCMGNLKVIVKNNNELSFKWEKKLIFNYKPISPLKISDIKTIIVDNGQSLKKIKTDRDTIYINNSNINSKDVVKLIEIIKGHNIKVIDSWDEFKEKGYAKTAYFINSVVLILSIILFITFTILKGFNPTLLSLFLLWIPQIILYRKQIKSKHKAHR
ncbi:hypothetical protein [Chryseobacterium cheonjiense]|uniref:Uncharacterized protein n=1 Tax=Chryseobacterium cheonjiense TaxID=2728845 RepID=A0A7Y0A9T2_9FLAO|nr:hypothetical protein [Chryseobacterium cheonjiense]NML59098.1 hypothetical protein [Chryseobacterium cheonjiense]